MSTITDRMDRDVFSAAQGTIRIAIPRQISGKGASCSSIPLAMNLERPYRGIGEVFG